MRSSLTSIPRWRNRSPWRRKNLRRLRLATKKAQSLLDEGLKTIGKHQKHIKVADCSATVEHYESHPLVTDSDDEKHLEKAEKEAERAANKHRCGGGTTGIKKQSGPPGTSPTSRPREPQVAVPPPLLPQALTRPPWVPVLGPCFSCGQYGHLARMFPKKTVYPLNQPVVGKAETHKSAKSRSDRCDQITAVRVSTYEVDDKQCVNNYMVSSEVNVTNTYCR